MNTTQDIARHLPWYLRTTSRSIVLSNVFIDGSPWECDAIRVTAAGFWTEYEIKTSLADYRADFAKRPSRWSRNGMTKHEAYGSPGPIPGAPTRKASIIPKPKHFYFVAPKGLLSDVDIPAHCGLIEVLATEAGHVLRLVRSAPALKSPTRLDQSSLFSLAVKASDRLITSQICRGSQ